MKNIYDRCRAMILRMEWSQNKMDSKGDTCPFCTVQQSVGHKVNGTCDLGILCNDLRTIDYAEKLKSGS